MPEVVEVARALPAREAILDGEVIALRPDGGPRPFQVTMRRFGRRLDVDALRHDLPLTPFFFDVLALDGEPLVDGLQADRFLALAGVAPRHSCRMSSDPRATRPSASRARHSPAGTRG